MKKPSKLNLESVVTIYGMDGFKNPNNNISRGSTFSLNSLYDVSEKTMIESSTKDKLKPTTTQPTTKTTCGSETILEDDICILDDRCSLGTHLENDTCVLDEQVSINKKQEKNMFAEFLDMLKSLFS